MDETFDIWYGPKSEYDYALYFDEEHERDLRDMIRVAYNHPNAVNPMPAILGANRAEPERKNEVTDPCKAIWKQPETKPY